MWTIFLCLLFHHAIGAPPRLQNDGISIGHRIQIATNKTRTGHAIKAEAEFRQSLISLFDLIDMNKDGIMDAAEFLKVCRDENIAITETEVDFVVTLPDNTVGFTKDKFVDLLLFSPSTKTSDLLLFMNHIAGTSNSRFSKAHTSASTGVKLDFEHRLEHVFLTLDVNHNCLIEADDLITLFGEMDTTLSLEDATTLLTIDDTDTLNGVSYPQWKYLVLNEVFKSSDTNLAHHWRTAFEASDLILDSEDGSMNVNAAIITKAKDIALATLGLGSVLDPCYSVTHEKIQTASVEAVTVNDDGNEAAGLTYKLELRVVTEGVSDCNTEEIQVAQVEVFKPYPQECHSEKDVITVETSITSEIICGSDEVRDGECSCEAGEGGVRSPCAGGQGCPAAGNCLDVCTLGSKAPSECFCHPTLESSGEACASGRGCDLAGICYDVCTEDTTNVAQCFCKKSDPDDTGVTCDANQGCDNTGLCLDVCTLGEKNALACFCNTEAAITGVSCLAGEGCIPGGGKCLPVCTLGSKNSAECFCHVFGGDTGVACLQDTQGCDSGGSCFDVCTADTTNEAQCFCKKSDDTGETCDANQGCDNTGDCLDVCLVNQVTSGKDCFCVATSPAGALCADGKACVTGGTCYPVCSVGSENSETCFCPAPETGGEVCAMGDGCTASGSCTKTCITGETDIVQCLCQIPLGGENLCQIGDGCDPDGTCQPACAADSTNEAKCFCESTLDSTGVTCEAGQGCADKDCVDVCASGENVARCFCEDTDLTSDSGLVCTAVQECLQGECLDVCSAGEQVVGSACYCSGVKCAVGSACKDDKCLDVCTDGHENDAECFCKNKHNYLGNICPVTQLGCDEGTCFSVCTSNEQTDATCFCTDMVSTDVVSGEITKAGQVCEPTKGCDEDGSCLTVCPLGVTNSVECFCAIKDGITGESCPATTHGCDADGECVAVCTSGYTDDDKCFCATVSGGDTCPASHGCVDGECLQVCGSDLYNENACFCASTLLSDCSGTECSGEKCSAGQGCGSDGICLDICSVGESLALCFCRDTVSDGGISTSGDSCISGQECLDTGVCKDVCDSGFTYTSSCLCKHNGAVVEECSANLGCIDGNCLAVCVNGQTNELADNCFCEPPADLSTLTVIEAGESCANAQGCTTDGSCLAVCDIDRELVSDCFCQTGGTGDSCDTACSSDGVCHDVCFSGYTNVASCLCKATSDPGSTGQFCAADEGCLGGACLAVCTNEMINTGDSNCFCEPPADISTLTIIEAGESCAPTQGCAQDGSCLTVCATDQALVSECFCEASGNAGDSCSGAHACDTDGVCHAVCTSGTTSSDSCFCEALIGGTSNYCAADQGCLDGQCLVVCDASPEGDCICVNSDTNTGGVLCGAGHSCDNGDCLASNELNFPDNKCFLESMAVGIQNVGKNHMLQNSQANWVLSSEGVKVSILENSRPSVGTTELGHTEGDPQAVRFTGEVIMTDDTDGDVIGMVFGFRTAVDFFIVASSGQDPPGGARDHDAYPATNWYVARVHMSCSMECAMSTATSDAIWNPAVHPTEITVLKEGTAHWTPNTRYTFAIDFDPENLELDVTVTSDGVDGTVLSTGGMISASVGVEGVDAKSSLGGYIGLYVDSQKDTHWEALQCQHLPVE